MSRWRWQSRKKLRISRNRDITRSRRSPGFGPELHLLELTALSLPHLLIFIDLLPLFLQQNFLLVEIVQHVVVLLAFLGVHGLSRFSQSPLFLGTFVTDATLVATIVL